MIDVLEVLTATVKFFVNFIFDQYALGVIDWILGMF